MSLLLPASTTIARSGTDYIISYALIQEVFPSSKPLPLPPLIMSR